MRFSVLCATFVATLLGFASLVPSAKAQGQAGHNIAVVDVSIVFKQHQRFKGMMDLFKKEVEAAQAKLKDEYTEIKSLQEQLKTLSPGTPDYKTMEARVAKAQADFQLKAQLQQKDFMEKEGRVYFQVYRELDDAVKRFAQKHQIALVLRYASEQIDDPNDRSEIIRGINKAIVYVNPALDITTLILEDLNRSGGAAGSNVGPGVQGVGRPPVAPNGTRRQ